MRRPHLTLRCVAAGYAANGQRIAEFSFPAAADGRGNLPGGLISLQYREGGAPLVSLSRVDGCDVAGPGLEEFAWTIEGEHFCVPGNRYSVHRTEAGAKLKAAGLVNELIKDAKDYGSPLTFVQEMTEAATPENWEAVLEELQRRRCADSAGAGGWEEGHDDMEDFDGDAPDCGVYIMKIPVEA